MVIGLHPAVARDGSSERDVHRRASLRRHAPSSHSKYRTIVKGARSTRTAESGVNKNFLPTASLRGSAAFDPYWIRGLRRPANLQPTFRRFAVANTALANGFACDARHKFSNRLADRRIRADGVGQRARVSLEDEPVVDSRHVQLGAERREQLGGAAHTLLEAPGSALILARRRAGARRRGRAPRDRAAASARGATKRAPSAPARTPPTTWRSRAEQSRRAWPACRRRRLA